MFSFEQPHGFTASLYCHKFAADLFNFERFGDTKMGDILSLRSAFWRKITVRKDGALMVDHSSIPNRESGAVRPTFRSSRENWKNRRAGSIGSDRQLETACAVVPSNLATAKVPPSASIASSAVCTTSKSAICNLSTVALEMSSLRELNIEHSRYVYNLSASDGSFDMQSRLEILARVRQLSDVLDKKEAELAEICGVTPQQWSNYRSDTEHNNEMPAKVALILWDAFGIPMEWIYDGQTNRVPNPDMREKLVLANRRAAAWIASRRPPKPRQGHMARVALATAVGAFLFVACSQTGMAYKRIDGAAVAASELAAVKVVCKGEAAKANLAAGKQAALQPDLLGYSGQMMDVYHGCMAEHGYLPDGAESARNP